MTIRPIIITLAVLVLVGCRTATQYTFNVNPVIRGDGSTSASTGQDTDQGKVVETARDATVDLPVVP